jgi:hypothetical protein
MKLKGAADSCDVVVIVAAVGVKDIQSRIDDGSLLIGRF